MVQADFFLEFPVGEFTRPAPFGYFNQSEKWCLWREIADVVLAFLSSPMFPDHPGTLTGKMLPLGILIPVRQPNVDGSKAARQRTFGPVSPDEVLPSSTADTELK